MELKNISNQELIQRIEKLVRTERKITHLVLLHIAEIEDRKIYADMGYDGMYAYLTRGLGYSEGSAYRRLQSARLLKQLPAVAEKIEDGSLNLTQLTQVQKIVKSESLKVAQEVLTKIENKSSFETQKVLATEFNLPIQTHEKIKPQQDDSVRLEITLTPEQYEYLKQAQSLLSHTCPSGSMADVIANLAKKFVQKKLKSATSNTGKINQQEASASNTESKNTIKAVTNTNSKNTIKLVTQSANARAERLNKKPYRKYISVHTKRELLQKANHQCQYVDHKSQQKCTSRFQLEIDHIKPLAIGGSDEVRNLRVLCRTHNAMMARGLF